MNMPRTRERPTAIIEKSPVTKERLWYKQPRRALVKASTKEKRIGTVSRAPKKEETLDVHTHNHAQNERLFVLPSRTDLKDMLDTPKLTSAIAIRRGKPVAGYTFVKIRRPKKTHKLEKFVKREPSSYLKYRAQPAL